jgi:hypothetical protein
MKVVGGCFFWCEFLVSFMLTDSGEYNREWFKIKEDFTHRNISVILASF